MSAINNYKSNKLLVLFLFFSLTFMIFIAQNEIVERGSIKYWLFLFPAILLPFSSIQSVISNVFIKTWPILLMFMFAFACALMRGELETVFRLVLFLLMFAWLERNEVVIRVKTLAFIYIAIVIVSIFVYLFFDINFWGLVPGETKYSDAVWRVSFFPNIANTAFFSLFIFMVCTKDKKTYMENKFVVYLCLYFIIFSFVRTAIISLMIYLLFNYLFKRVKNKKTLFVSSVLVALVVNLLIAFSTEIIYAIQSSFLINRFLLRGEQSLSYHDIYVQMYRPWVWAQQWNIFMSSPFLMGEGLYNFGELTKSNVSGAGHVDTDSVSLLLGMLAEYGLFAVLFYYYMLRSHYKNAMVLDQWACAIFPIIFLICMQWGAIFHPANAMFIMYFLVLLRGKKAFI